MPNLTTELEAVNSMLGHIGEAPVNSISNTSSLPVSVSSAVSILDETSREVQSEGWHFNTEKDVKYSPDASNKTITVGSDILEIDAVDPSIDIVQRGTQLFDRGENTTEFDNDIKVNLIRLLTFTTLPETARRYITLRASRVLQARLIGSKELESLIARDEFQARGRLLDADGSNSDATIFNSYDTATRVGINRSSYI